MLKICFKQFACDRNSGTAQLIAKVCGGFVAFLAATIFLLIAARARTACEIGVYCAKRTLKVSWHVSRKGLWKTEEFGQPLAGRGT